MKTPAAVGATVAVILCVMPSNKSLQETRSTCVPVHDKHGDVRRAGESPAMPPHPQPLLELEPLGERGPPAIKLGDGGVDPGHQPLVTTGPHGSRAEHDAVVADAGVGDVQCAGVERGRLAWKRRHSAAAAKHVEADPRQHALLARTTVRPAVIADPKMLEQHRLLQHAGDLLRPTDEPVEQDRSGSGAELGIEPRV